MKYLKILFLSLIALNFFIPQRILAQTTTDSATNSTKTEIIDSNQQTDEQTAKDNARVNDLFEAKVIQVIEEADKKRPDGKISKQQHLKLKGLTKKWKDKEFEVNNISEIVAINSNYYKVGDHVLVNHQIGPDKNDVFYIADYVRRWPLYFLAFLFALVVIIIGTKKGFKSLIALIITFIIILKGMIPLILAGWNPLIIGIVSSIIIMFFMIYITDGWNQQSHLAILSIALSLILVGLLAYAFSIWAHLTGMAGEETLFLIGVGRKALNFKGLLLAGILIGTLGVLDDVVLGQIETVKQIREANPKLPDKQIFKMANKVGTTHIGSMVNTLFLAYAGSSMALLLLFSINEPPFLTFTQVINNEMIATEIVRTLVGSIGLALSMPLATYLAVKIIKR